MPAYNGVTVSVDGALAPLERDETLIVCAGEDVGKNVSKKLISWLRNEVRRGMDFGALSSGTYVLALAGLLSGKRVTTHWEYRAALTEILPDVIIEDAIFTVDGRIFTTAGGAASMDMMLDRIRTEHGPQLATWVADQMVYTDPRLANHAQRIKLQARAQVRNAKLGVAIQIMENNIEDPLTPDEISDVIGLSTRQLERLFAKHVGVSPKRYYLGLRLEKARDLLRQTDFSVTDVCVACGFKSLSHFSKSYRAAYGISPGLEGSGTKLVWRKDL